MFTKKVKNAPGWSILSAPDMCCQTFSVFEIKVNIVFECQDGFAVISFKLLSVELMLQHTPSLAYCTIKILSCFVSFRKVTQQLYGVLTFLPLNFKAMQLIKSASPWHHLEYLFSLLQPHLQGFWPSTMNITTLLSKFLHLQFKENKVRNLVHLI